MASIWTGVIREYADYLPKINPESVISLGEGGTPLIYSKIISNRVHAEVYIKFEGVNPTGSFKDRGMTVAISRAVDQGAKAVVCASTGNTSAAAAAYSAFAGLDCLVLIPQGKVATGKLSQAIAHGAKIVQLPGNFDMCLRLARSLSDEYAVHLVNSVNPDRIEGQKTAAFEVFDALGTVPDIHVLPVGNAGNITAYFKGYSELVKMGKTEKLPRMWGFQASGAAPIVLGHVVDNPETVASAIRIGNPASWQKALIARDETNGLFGAISDEDILAAQRMLSSQVGVFVEPASAISLAGLFQQFDRGAVRERVTIVLTVTGHGLKDPQWAAKEAPGDPVITGLPNDVQQIADVLELSKA